MIDKAGLHAFFMGVLGWTPQTLRAGASLYDLQQALNGRRGKMGVVVPRGVTRGFLEDMLRRFPDGREGAKT